MKTNPNTPIDCRTQFPYLCNWNEEQGLPWISWLLQWKTETAISGEKKKRRKKVKKYMRHLTEKRKQKQNTTLKSYLQTPGSIENIVCDFQNTTSRDVARGGAREGSIKAYSSILVPTKIFNSLVLLWY